MKMTKQQKEEWTILCEYMKNDVFHFTADEGFPRHLVLRLKGMATNRYIPKGDDVPIVYPFRIILLSCKLNKSKIMYALDNVEFKNETHKINYIMTIIEGSLNDIVIRMKKKAMTENSLQKQIDIDIAKQDNQAEYISKTNKNKKDIMKEFW